MQRRARSSIVAPRNRSGTENGATRWKVPLASAVTVAAWDPVITGSAGTGDLIEERSGADQHMRSSYRIGRGTAELVQTFLDPPPPSGIHPGAAFAMNGAPIPPQGAPDIVAHVDLCSWTVRLPAPVEDGTTKFT